jgi:hypothetical protein
VLRLSCSKESSVFIFETMASEQAAQKYHLLGPEDDGTSDTSFRRSYEDDRPLARWKRWSYKSMLFVTAIVILVTMGGFALGFAFHASRCVPTLSPYSEQQRDSHSGPSN